jgi:hypothetical protein
MFGMPNMQLSVGRTSQVNAQLGQSLGILGHKV